MGLVTYKEDGFWSKPQFAFSSVFSGDGLVVVFQPPACCGRRGSTGSVHFVTEVSAADQQGRTPHQKKTSRCRVRYHF
jgi:hypothetical protein